MVYNDKIDMSIKQDNIVVSKASNGQHHIRREYFKVKDQNVLGSINENKKGVSSTSYRNSIKLSNVRKLVLPESKKKYSG